MYQHHNIAEKENRNRKLEQLDNEIFYLENEVKRLKKENKISRIRIERKNLELYKYWLKELGKTNF